MVVTTKWTATALVYHNFNRTPAKSDQDEKYRQRCAISELSELTKPLLGIYANSIREVCKKSKWKFKMAFAMKGGGLEGVSFAIKLFWKMIFFKNHLESFPDCENVFCT